MLRVFRVDTSNAYISISIFVRQRPFFQVRSHSVVYMITIGWGWVFFPCNAISIACLSMVSYANGRSIKQLPYTATTIMTVQ